MRSLPLISLFVILAAPCRAQAGYVAPNAPKDKTAAMDSAATARLDSAIAPYIAQAKASWPGAKGRFMAGLPARHGFFVTTRIHDDLGKFEQVFIAVDSLARDSVFGNIQSQIMMVRGYRLGQRYALPESELMDWLISRPDGTEEGNVVGNFMDTYQP